MFDKIFFIKDAVYKYKIRNRIRYYRSCILHIIIHLNSTPSEHHLSWQTQCIQAKSVTEMLRLSIVSTIIITIIISMNNNNNCCTEKRAAGATVLPIYVPLYHQVIHLYILFVYNNNILWSLAVDRSVQNI